jgi:Protein of unknown function (DUF2510)
MGTALSTVSSLGVNTIAIEAPIALIVIVLIVILLIMNSRKKKGPKPAKEPAAAASTEGYYADLQQPGAQPQGAAQPAAFGAGDPAGAPPPGPASPPPGTPAGWLADPGGAPNTLRYWDGNAWTQHVAARS